MDNLRNFPKGLVSHQYGPNSDRTTPLPTRKTNMRKAKPPIAYQYDSAYSGTTFPNIPPNGRTYANDSRTARIRPCSLTRAEKLSTSPTTAGSTSPPADITPLLRL